MIVAFALVCIVAIAAAPTGGTKQKRQVLGSTVPALGGVVAPTTTGLAATAPLGSAAPSAGLGTVSRGVNSGLVSDGSLTGTAINQG